MMQTTKRVTKTEYASMRRNHYAGTVRTLEASTVYSFAASHPDWDGKRWGMWFESGSGTVLGPINVVADASA